MKMLANRYRIERLLGEGGMGKVYLVKDTVTDAILALKLIEKGSALQLKQEFWTLTRLRHPNFVEVFDFGLLEDGSPFFTMEFAPGRDLAEEALEGPLSPPRLREILGQLLPALGFIHSRGFVHCDLNPRNVRVTEKSLKLLDFGLMEPIGRTHGPVKGTLSYFSPEVIKGGRVDQRSDLYSLGIVAYHLLTGHPPFEGTLAEVIEGHLDQEIPLTGTLLDPVIRKLAAKNPGERFQSAEEALSALGFGAGEGRDRHRRKIAIPPFTGRADEIGLLENQLAAVSAGLAARSILLAGESGVGKSRLLEEFRFRTQLGNTPFFEGHCLETGVPFGPFLSILRQVLPLAKNRDPKALERLSPRLARLLPELSGGGSVDELEPRQERIRLFAAFHELLTSLLPAVLAFEDLQWLDESSRELLAYLLRNSEGSPLLLIGTSTSSDTPFPLASHLNLTGFSRPECRDFVASILGSEPAPALLSGLLEKANGNPLFIEGLLAHLERKGLLGEEGEFNEALLDDVWPDGLEHVLLASLEALSEEARELADILAVLGRGATIDLLARIGRKEEEVFFAALDELSRRQVLDRVEGRYLFRQSLLPVLLCARLSPDALRSIHRSIAESLEEMQGESGSLTAELANALARHFLQGGPNEKALEYALEAARIDVRLHALSEAENLLEAGLALLEKKDKALDYLHLLGDVRRARSLFPEALEALGQALELSEAADAPEKSCNILISLGKINQVLSNYPEALAHIEKARGLCSRTADQKALARCHTAAGRIVFFLGETSKAAEHYEEARAIAARIDDQALNAESLAFLGFMAVSDGRLVQGLAFLEQSLSIKEALGDKIGLIDTLMLLGNARLSLGSFGAARQDFLHCRELAHETGQKDEEIFSGINLSLTAIEKGDFALAAELAEAALATAEATSSKFAVGSAATLKAFAAAQRGALAEAFEGMAAALDIARETSNRYLEVFSLVYQTEMLALLGKWGEALDAGMAAKNLIREMGGHEGELTLFAALGEIYGFLGEGELAGDYLEKAKKLAQERGSRGAMARVLKAQAILECRREAWDNAKQAAEEAISLAREIGARFLEGNAQWIEGEVFIALGQREKAREHYQAALSIARETGSAPLELLAVKGLILSDPGGGSAHRKRFGQLLEEMLVSLSPPKQEAFRGLWPKYSLCSGKDKFSPEDLDEDAVRLMDQMQGFAERLRSQMGEWSSLRRSHAHLELLVNFSLEVNRLHTLDEVLNRVVELIVGLTGSERGFLLLYREGRLQCRAVKNIHEEADWQFSEGIAKTVLLNEEPLCIFDALTDERFRHQEAVQLLRLRTVICVPLKIHDQAVGVIYVDRQSINDQFSLEDLDLVLSLAAQAANAIENALLHSEWQDKSRKLEMLNTLSRTVSSTLVPSEVNELVIKLTLEVTDAERGFLFLNDGTEPRCMAAFDRQGKHLDVVDSFVSQSILNRVLSDNEPAIILDAAMDETLQSQASIMALDLRTVMCVPLKAKEKTVGLLYVDSRAVRSFAASDLELLEAIASHTSIAIENASLYSELSRRAAELDEMMRAYEVATLQASIDSLTGIYNRRHFVDAFRRDFDQARRHRRSLAMMMIDIDYFKSFNDTYGHGAGDVALKTVANLIQQAVRTVDVVARYGGEEFIVGLPDTDLDGALIVAERIRCAVEVFPMASVLPEGTRGLTVSLGIALCSGDDERIAEPIERADQSLYEAKKAGRNRIVAN